MPVSTVLLTRVNTNDGINSKPLLGDSLSTPPFGPDLEHCQLLVKMLMLNPTWHGSLSRHDHTLTNTAHVASGIGEPIYGAQSNSLKYAVAFMHCVSAKQ